MSRQSQLVIAPGKMESRAKASKPKLREATFDDYEGISRLESRYGLIPKSYENWKHLWIDNPTFHEFRHWPIGWVCENEEKEIVGSIGNIPLAYEFEDRSLVTATSRGLVVDSGYGPYSFSLLAQFFEQQNIDLFLNTSVNEKVFRLQELFGALRVPVGIWDQSAFWVTNYPRFARSVLATRSVQGSLSYPLSAGLFCWDKLREKGSRKRHAGLQTQFCANFGREFDVFWQAMRKSIPRRLLANRSRAILDWHFGPALREGCAWVITVHDAGGLVAYAVFSRQDNEEIGLRRMRLVDFQALGERTDLLKPVLSAALQKCRQESIDMLETIGFAPNKRRVIDGMGAHYRPLSAWRYFYKTNRSSLAAGLGVPDSWDPTCFDGDCSL
jgi:hypothetical protein